MKKMRSAIGYVCLAVAIYFVYKSIEKRREIRACHGKKIDATIIDNKVQVLGGGMCVYYPVYNYEMDGETKTYQGKCPSAIMMELGTQVPLYYNCVTRTPVEIASIASDLTLAMVFGGVSVLLLNI